MLSKKKNRREAINLAKKHSQVPGNSIGEKIDELNATSQDKNWSMMKLKGATKLG